MLSDKPMDEQKDLLSDCLWAGLWALLLVMQMAEQEGTQKAHTMAVKRVVRLVGLTASMLGKKTDILMASWMEDYLV
jgi:hypothetical protein